MTSEVDAARRFGGVRRLYGIAGLTRLQAAHVCVVGIGGVGSWAAEALARNAVGRITLIDLDNIAESNVNRQIHALEGAFGKAKVTAMRERILAINPSCQVTEIEDFVTPENVNVFLNANFSAVLDAVDDAKAKVAMAAFCRAQKIPLVMTGGAGGRLDATNIKIDDLAFVTGDRLLAKVRNQLRRDFNFPKGQDGAGKKNKQAQFGITAIYSDEQVLKPEAACEVDGTAESAITGLNCAGYGSSVCVTAPFGFIAAGAVIQRCLF